jgi:predicted transposase/invertase (TIGR01784 family)
MYMKEVFLLQSNNYGEKMSAKKRDHGDYNAYKQIFEHPDLVQQLLMHFSEEDFLNELDFSSLKKSDKSFTASASGDGESDILFTAKFNGRDIYIYILIEFQSAVDRFMSQRMLKYILELYDYLISTERLRTLPAVFPVLLYNGNDRWTSPVDIFNLIQTSGIPEKYIPHFRYCKIAENEFSTEFILKFRDFTSALFYAENSDKEMLINKFHIIIRMLENEKPEYISLFKNWLNHIFEIDNKEFSLKTDNIKKDSKMGLAQKVEIWRKELLLEGEMHGIEKGKAVGVRLGIIKGIEKTVKKMLLHGMTNEEISDITDITIEQIEMMRIK